MREEIGPRPPPEDAYRMALDRIHEGLDAHARLVLQLASVLGARLNDLSMYQIIDLGLGVTGQAMTNLRAARLIRETEERLEFVNELIRGHTYLSIPKPMRTALHSEVVGRLLAAEAKGRHVPGLEIAWHLIRAGRSDEATPHLLRGARESMRGGAPYEAERGLTTAMDRMQEPDRSEAMLLIGEALQEQGRMNESLGFLEGVSEAARPAILSRRNVLKAYGLMFFGAPTAERSHETTLALLNEATISGHPNTRLRALWCAASLVRDHPEPGLIDAISRQLDMEVWEDLSIEDKGEFALARAFCQYYAGEKELGLETIASILGDLESSGVSNSVYLALLVGLGVIHSSLGEYQAAVAIADKGIRVARKMGEERRLRMLAANLALAHWRLGNTSAQLRWAEWAVSIPGTSSDAFSCQQIHFLRARAYASQGRIEDALAALTEAQWTQEHPAPPLVRQAWHLRLADVLSILGREVDALREARAGVTGELASLKSDLFAGPYARWSAKVGVDTKPEEVDAGARLTALLDRERHLDLVDQAEVLNAKVWLDAKMAAVDGRQRQEMYRRLNSLPPGVEADLRKMGMLDL